MKEFKPIKYEGTEVVVQNNFLIDAPRNLNLQEQKLFLFLISKINPQDQNKSMLFRIHAREFAAALGTTNINNLYRDIRNVVKTLQKRVITLYKTENNVETVTDLTLIPYAKYWTSLGYADIEINYQLLPFLSELHQQFTRYKLSNITKLSSIYAIRLYEMIKKQEILGQRTFFIDDLRRKLQLLNGSLKQFKDFRVRVLEISKREINAKTDLIIDYSFKKSGRKIEAITFSIYSKNEETSKNKNFYLSKLAEEKSLQKILDFGYSKSQAKSILNNSDISTVDSAIAVVTDQMASGNVKNPGAMLNSAIKNKWKPSKQKTTPKITKKNAEPKSKISKFLDLFR